MAKSKSKSRGKCKKITFKKKNGRTLPKSKWVTVTRCEGRKLKAHNRRQCRAKDLPGSGRLTKFQKNTFVTCP